MRKRRLIWFVLGALLLGFVGVSLYFRRPVEYRSDQFLMDTLVSIRVFGTNEEALRKAVGEAYAEMHRIADLTDNFPAEGTTANRESDVNRINEMAGVKPVRVDQDVFTMLELAKSYHDLADGAFDVTIGPVMRLWGFGGNSPHVPRAADIMASLVFVDNARLVLNRKEQTAFLGKSGMALDLGAIAKGYATEKALQALKRNGIKKALIDAGGNIRVLGTNAGGEAWRIGIKNPLKSGDILAVLSLKDSAAVTSGDYYRYFESGGRRYNHILNPLTGYPAAENLSVTVVTKDAGLADILSTAFFVLNAEKVLEVVEKLEGVDVFLVTVDRRILYSPGLKGRIELRAGADFHNDQSR
ncbi:MAG: FAD:protein FMN transferase [Geobacter sp.]|nr:MAG: FAD:protein FMN transferase [Geobacter sp.]